VVRQAVRYTVARLTCVCPRTPQIPAPNGSV
jgi:hypothetical protein